jgi:hypothetical protein
MPLRSVYEISMDDSKVRDFFDAFSAHREEVGGAGEEWAKAFQRAGTAAQGVTQYLKQFESEFKDLGETATKAAKDQAAAMGEVADAARKAATWQAQFGAAVSTGSHHLGTAAKSARSIAGDLAEGTRWLMKWTGISTAIGGLVGAGSLFGLDRLAAGAGDRRFQAQGLGVQNSANQQAFSLAYSRVVDPTSFLSNVASAKSDYTKAKTWVSLGIGPDQLKNLDTVDLAKLALERMQSVWRAQPDHSTQMMTALGLDNLGGMENLRRLMAADPGLGKEGTQYGQLKRELYVPDSEQQAWQDFSIQLHAAGDKVVNAFIDSFGKAHLPEELSKLSDAASEAIRTFLTAPQLKVWLDELGEGLKNTATFMTSKEFEDDVHEFIAAIGDMGRAIRWFLTVTGFKATFLSSSDVPEVDLQKWGVTSGPYNPYAGGPSIGITYDDRSPMQHLRNPPPAIHASGPPAAVQNWWDQFTPSWFPGRSDGASPGPTGHASGAAPNDALFNWASIGGTGDAGQQGRWAQYSSPEAGVRSVRDLLLGGKSGKMYFGGGEDTLSQIISTWAPPGENNTAQLISRASQWMGVGPDTKLDPKDPETMRRLVTAMIANEHGGVLPRDLSQQQINTALGSGGGASGSSWLNWLNPFGSAHAAPMPGFGGKTASGVDSHLDAAMRFAVSQLPAGYTAKMTSGVRTNNPNSQHFLGHAEDWQIFDPQGNPIPNRGEDTTGLYRTNAINAIRWLRQNYPDDAGKLAWGGHFETSAGSGVPDLMHYDIGGPRGRFGDPMAEQNAVAAEFKQALKEGMPANQNDPPSSAPHLSPTQTGGYSGSVSSGSKVNINVHNMTGGSAIISADQLAHQ